MIELNEFILTLTNAVYCYHLRHRVCLTHPCQHYIGFAHDLRERDAAHRAGQGARLLQVALERGIEFELVWAIPGSREVERLIKRRKNGRRYCPICCAADGVQVWRISAETRSHITSSYPVQPAQYGQHSDPDLLPF